MTRSVTAAARTAIAKGSAGTPRDRHRTTQTSAQGSAPVHVRGASRDPNRGKWCTRKQVADAVGGFDLDPCSNPHSHIVSQRRCMLEDGGNGLDDPQRPGSWRDGDGGSRSPIRGIADERTRVWIQPSYGIVQAVLDHYLHTRFVALLRFDPRTDWFKRLWARTALCGVLWDASFEPPPGVKASSNTFPHALFFARIEDATPAALRLVIAWRTNNGPTTD